jgi:geranylgeranyl diphosphate synthase type II
MMKEYIRKRRILIDKELEGLVPPQSERPQIIHRAIRYSLKGGKRIRSILCLSCAEAVGGTTKQSLKTACAIEMIHTYSLIHDDLPSMDDDDYRRGKLACHKKFGEANAILTGDALLTLAFNTLASATPNPSTNARIIRELSLACGSLGMIGGQAQDISDEEKDQLTLEYININKTGALITSSCKAGAIAADSSEKDIRTLQRFGEYIGFAFQIVDDILDGEGFVRIMGKHRAYRYAAELVDKAKGSISYFKKKAQPLYGIADFILNRKY